MGKSEEFIERARKVHGMKYDYSMAKYEKSSKKVLIKCPKHGNFWQSPSHHLRGQGCPACKKEKMIFRKKYTTSDFIEKAKGVHGEKFDYSKVNYEKSSKKVCIICPVHGEFWQCPTEHFNYGCPKCGKTQRLTLDEFIEKAKMMHGDKYDYSNVEYKNNKTKVCIICPKHGEFWQRPDMHLKGQGCVSCSREKNGLKKRKSNEDFINEARNVHGNRYDYSKVEYKDSKTKVCIICPIHGEFWQLPHNHLHKNGCKKCAVSKLENDVIELLGENGIQFTFRERKLPWLNGLELDFYLPEHHTAIECQGVQHFVKQHFFEPLEVVQERDKRKHDLCERNGIKLLYYSDLNIEYPYPVYEDKKRLLKDIINGKKW